MVRLCSCRPGNSGRVFNRVCHLELETHFLKFSDVVVIRLQVEFKSPITTTFCLGGLYISSRAVASEFRKFTRLHLPGQL